MTEELSSSKKTNFYEDNYVKDNILQIKLYYFPYGNRTIKISDIKSLKYAQQSESYAKNWGSSSFTWWACDMKRNFRDAKKIFYNDVVSFIRAMKNHLVGCEIGRLDALA